MTFIPRRNFLFNNDCFLAFIILLTLFISACSDPQITKSAAEKALDYQNNRGTIESNALDPTKPNGLILSPVSDLLINTGDSVDFSATAIDPNGDPLISYLWDFNKSINNNNLSTLSTVQNPGLIKFLIPGTYKIELTAINSLGQPDPSKDYRIITVKPNSLLLESNTPLADHEPIATIDSPVGDMTINIGDVINFSGSGVSPDGNDPVTFLWNFGDLDVNNTVAMPGDVQFNEVGEHIISLVVTDSTGLVSLTPALVTITVNPIGTENLAPIGEILSPPGDVNINPGETIYFAGSASDPDGNEPITYAWDFSGVIPESSLAIPDRITFPDAGQYVVTLTTTDSLGLTDPNPPKVTITVGDVAPPTETPVLTNAILTPTSDMTISLGQTVNFTGASPNDINTGPFIYLWSFDGLMENSMMQNPGDITFNQLGAFNVTLTIADVNGNVITRDAHRTITVIDPDILSVNIIEPAGDQTINPGESINFSANVTDPLGNVEFTALWSFSGAAPDSDLLSPGAILFETVGTYEINLTVTDPLTDRTAMAESRTITVADPNALTNGILTPDGNQTINIGDTINFTGIVNDPIGSTALEYLWNFDGVAPNASTLSPGDITFGTAGTFDITFIVSDPVDLRSAQAEVIEITVLDPSALQANIISPANDMFIQLGDAIDFMGEVIDPIPGNPISYSWDFGMPDILSTELNPGLITFNMLGEFDVMFKASDTITARESTVATRTIHVMDVTSTPPAPPTPDPDPTAPQGIIESPAGDMTITVGSVVLLEASANNPANLALTYNWDFGNGLNLQVQNPGSVRFTVTGEYIITLSVSDENGVVDPSPPSIVITVN